MGVRFPSVFVSGANAVSIPTTVETVVATLPPLTLPLDGAVVFLLGVCSWTVGTAATSAAVRIRRGTTTAGVLVGSNGTDTNPVTAGVNAQFTVAVFDQPGAVGPVQYVLTVVQFAATGNGATQWSQLMAFAL